MFNNRMILLLTTILSLLFPLFLRSRYKIIQTNLRIAMPQLSRKKRKKLRDNCIKHTLYSMLSLPFLFDRPREYFVSNAKVIGWENVEKNRSRGILFLVPHMCNMDYSVLTLSQLFDRKFYITYRPLHNQYLEKIQLKARKKMCADICPAHHLKKILTWLKEKKYVHFAPDHAVGRYKKTHKVAFMHQVIPQWSTHIRLAEITGAAIIPIVTFRNGLTDNITMKFLPSLSFKQEDSMEMKIQKSMQYVETSIEYAPSQYLWTHRRFKTKDFIYH